MEKETKFNTPETETVIKWLAEIDREIEVRKSQLREWKAGNGNYGTISEKLAKKIEDELTGLQKTREEYDMLLTEVQKQ